ncbi:MAG: LuxR C-terminal-related transcriptional regulator [Pseudomonadota bacterium]
MNSNIASATISTIGFHSLRVCSMGRGPMTRPAHALKGGMMAGFDLSMNIKFLFPYINAVARKAQLYENPSHIRFHFDHILCVLYPKKGLASPLDDTEHARSFMTQFLSFLNDINHSKDNITPRYKLFSQTDVTRILKLLPKTNCNACGFNTCMAFAAMLSRQQTIPSRCPHIGQPVQEKAIFPINDKDGNLLSTIALDIDYSENRSALKSANQYIQNLEQKISNLTQTRKEKQELANKTLPTPLTKREIQVLEMVACGTTNVEIALTLFISPHTVKSHIDHIFNKLNVNSRTQASVWASRHHFV